MNVWNDQIKEIDNPTIPVEFHTRWDPAEDITAAVTCLVCGESVPLHRYESGPRICRSCKDAVLYIRNKLEQKEE